MEPTLDNWTSFFLLAVAMGLFLFILLIAGRIKRNLPIAFLILAFSLILFQYVLYWTRYEEVFPYLILTPPICYLSTGPLLYLYFLNLYKNKISAYFSLHFIPALIATLPSFVMWFRYLEWTSMEIPLISYVNSYWLITAHMILYTLFILYQITNNSVLDSEYKKVRHNWSRVLVSLYAIFILAYVSYYVLINFSFFNSQWDYAISITMSISIYTIGYFIMKQPKIFDGELFANIFLPILNKEERFEVSLINEFYENLTHYMIHQKPYIDNELRLVNLADQVGFSTHLLSKIINKKAGKNFNNFINEYRLKEAEEILLSNSEQYIKNIYYDVGFNNKATFYKAFKVKFNCTPSEYKSKLVKA